MDLTGLYTKLCVFEPWQALKKSCLTDKISVTQRRWKQNDARSDIEQDTLFSTVNPEQRVS
jgi:hypothetical protein